MISKVSYVKGRPWQRRSNIDGKLKLVRLILSGLSCKTASIEVETASPCTTESNWAEPLLETDCDNSVPYGLRSGRATHDQNPSLHNRS